MVLTVEFFEEYKTIFSLLDYLALQATVVTIRELKESISNESSDETFIVQCFLTQFDLDGPANQLIGKRW